MFNTKSLTRNRVLSVSVFVVVALLAICLPAFTNIAFAEETELMVAGDEAEAEDPVTTSDEYDEFCYFMSEFEGDGGFYCDTTSIRLEPNYDDYCDYITEPKASIKINGKWKYAKRDRRADFEGDYIFKKLKPNKKYRIRFTCKGKVSGKSYVAYRNVWTSPRGVSCNPTARNWKRSKGAKGYIVYYNYVKVMGYNAYGTKVYRDYSKTKYIKTNKVRLPKNATITGVVPYSKHGNYYYVPGDLSRFSSMKSMKDGMSESFYHQYYRP